MFNKRQWCLFSGNHICQRLVVRLFASLALSVLLILLSFTAVEMVLYERFLTLPNKVQRELQQLSASANQQRQLGAEALAQWEMSQPYLLYVIDSTNHVVSGRDIHPHVQMKMRNARQLNEPMGTRVSKPMIIVPMTEGYSLMVQLPWQQHPASRAGYYLWSTNLLLSLLILTLISWVLSRQLQRPLARLQSASRAVAQGITETRVSQSIGHSPWEFQQLAADFDNMAEQIQGLIEEQRKLVRTLSHELKTPLTRQALALHLASHTDVAQERTQWLVRAEQEAQLMDSMIEKILELSRLRSLHCDVVLQPLDVQAYLSQQTEQFRPHLQPTQQLRFVPSGQDEWIRGDRVLLGSILDNLLTNATKYAGEQCCITVMTKKQDRQVKIIVMDDGPGVESEQLEAIFRPFYQTMSTLSSRHGYGLGLSIVQQSVEKMHGHVSAENNHGLVVTLSFPVYLPSELSHRHD